MTNTSLNVPTEDLRFFRALSEVGWTVCAHILSLAAWLTVIALYGVLSKYLDYTPTNIFYWALLAAWVTAVTCAIWKGMTRVYDYFLLKFAQRVGRLWVSNLVVLVGVALMVSPILLGFWLNDLVGYVTILVGSK